MDSSREAPLEEVTGTGGASRCAAVRTAGVREVLDRVASLPAGPGSAELIDRLRGLLDQAAGSGDAPRGVAVPSTRGGGAAAGPSGLMRIASVRDLIGALASLAPGAAGAESIEEIRACEDLKSLVSARQARTTVAFDVAERTAQAAAGVPAAERGKGVAAQVALARRESPARGGMLLGLARALVAEMPHTLTALESGQVSEWRAALLVRETACLSAADRCAVDEDLSAETGVFEGAGTRRIVAAARAAAYRRDPRSVVGRAARAARDRCVSLRPAPDTMTYLTALLPVTEGVAVHAELTRYADTCRAQGDERGRGQVMADALVERVTGVPGGVSRVEVQLIMTDRALFQGDSEPARVPGYGIVPAAWARTLLTQQPSGPGEHGAGLPDGIPAGAGPGSASGPEPRSRRRKDSRQGFEVWLRRLYTAPGAGELVAVDSKARLFTPGQRRFLQARDDACRTPYCDAPIRHYDHVVPWHGDGPTSLSNGAGLCEACNHTKERPGWRTTPTARAAPGARHTIEVRTPTGHTYRSTAPPLPGSDHENREQQGAGTGHSRGSTRHAPDHRASPTPHPASYSRRVDLVFA